MAAPTVQTNGRTNAADPALQLLQIEAAERATSSVLALDGWGRLEPEPHSNGAVQPPQPPATSNGGARDQLEARPVRLVERLAVRRAPQLLHDLPPLPPAFRLLGPAALFGLAVGALVGAGLRWWELRSAPPPPLPTLPPAAAPRGPSAQRRERLLTRLTSLQQRDPIAVGRRIRALVSAPPPALPPAPPPPPPTARQRALRRWRRMERGLSGYSVPATARASASARSRSTR